LLSAAVWVVVWAAWTAWVDFNLRKSIFASFINMSSFHIILPTSPYLHNCHLYTHSQYSPLSRSTLSTMVSDFCRINDIFELILCVRIYRQVVWLRSYHRPCSITRDDTVRVAIKKTRGNSPLKKLYLHIEALAFSKPNIVTRRVQPLC
jgi:hypothetical protein